MEQAALPRKDICPQLRAAVVPTADFYLVALLCASLLFYWMIQQGAPTDKRAQMLSTGRSVGPPMVPSPAARTSIQTICSLTV